MTSRFTIVTSDRPGTLVGRLARDLGERPLPPFSEELIVVQSRGTERWVRHELARRHGCAASLQFPFPASFCHQLAQSMHDARIDARFGRDALTWRILDDIERRTEGGDVAAPLRRFLAEPDTRKRLGLAARIAARFDDYQLYRPDALLAWERGELPEDAHLRWQSELWRRLCAGDAPPLHLARWFTSAVEELESAAHAPAGLPERISVFGVSTLPAIFARLLHAAARFAEVRVYVLAPPRATWQHDAPRNELFSAFGTASRELLDLLAQGDVAWQECFDDLEPPRSALQHLRHDVRTGVARGPDADLQPPVRLLPGDDSLSVHLCHSPMREMEVLRDQLFAAFAGDPTLRPHDVLLLVPDVPLYAPFVEAVFEVGEPELPRIPVHVADRPIGHESSMADAALRLLRLVGARWTSAEVMELLDVPAVRRASGIAPGAGARVVRWVEEVRIRWGRNGRMRQELFGVPPVEANSWEAGLDRLLMGYAVGPEEELVNGLLPHSGHTIGDPDTLGAFAQWLEQLFDTLDEWRTPRDLATWSATLGDAMRVLLAPDDEAEQRGHSQLLGSLASLGELQELSGCSRAIDVGVVREWLERTLADDSASSGFLVGGMTVAAMKPMRAIPFRIIAMAGLDEQSFPRSSRRVLWDMLELESRPGDRDVRADDRQLFLDTILSAADRLILSYVGRSARDNKVRASSVVVAELLNVVDRTFAIAPYAASGKPMPARSAIVVEHRLQPFSTHYYAASGDDAAGARLFSYSRVNARATLAAMGDRQAPPAFVQGTIAPEEIPSAISLRDLIDCWTNPSRFYCHRALELRLPADSEPLGDCEPMEVNGLTRYAIGDRILARHLAGPRDRERERMQAAAFGALPPGMLAPLWFDRIDRDLAGFLERAGTARFEEPVSLHVAGSDWHLTGQAHGMTGDGRLQLRPTKCKSKDLVTAWITHLALTAAYGPLVTRVVATDGETVFGEVDGAMARLDELVAGYRHALTEPLPVFEHASREYVERARKRDAGTARANARDPLDAARDCFTREPKFGAPGGDREDDHVALCWRGRDPFAPPAEFIRWSELLWRPAMSAMGGSEEDDA